MYLGVLFFVTVITVFTTYNFLQSVRSQSSQIAKPVKRHLDTRYPSVPSISLNPKNRSHSPPPLPKKIKSHQYIRKSVLHVPKPQEKLDIVIVIPYRDRAVHYEKIMNHLPSIRRENWNLHTILVEQDDTEHFKRAWLLNIGITEASKRYPTASCIVTHDVDMIADSKVDYSWCDRPTQICSELSCFKNSVPYKNSAGGVVQATLQDWRKINGFTNTAIGWGGEDDDLHHRFRMANLLTDGTLRRPQKGMGKCHCMNDEHHTKRVQHGKGYNDIVSKIHRMQKNSDEWKRDGLNTLQYHITSETTDRFGTLHFKVKAKEDKRLCCQENPHCSCTAPKGNIWKAFSSMIRLLNSINAQYNICFGTALHWYRDSTLGDSDIDICIDLEWMTENLELLHKTILSNKWKKNMYFGKTGKVGYEESYLLYGVKVDLFSQSFSTKGTYITGYTIKGQTYPCYSYIDNIVKAKWGDLDINVVAPMEKYLVKKYGYDWNKEIPHNKWSEQNHFKNTNGKHNCVKTTVDPPKRKEKCLTAHYKHKSDEETIQRSEAYQQGWLKDKMTQKSEIKRRDSANVIFNDDMLQYVDDLKRQMSMPLRLTHTKGAVALVAIFKSNIEVTYLEEWLHWYLLQGVDSIFLYANGPLSGDYHYLKQFEDKGILTIIPWDDSEINSVPPAKRRERYGGIVGWNTISLQELAMQHWNTHYKHLTNWVIKCDIDEYMYTPTHGSLREMLESEASDIIHCPRIEYGSSNHKTRPSGLIIESYTHSHPRNKFSNFKSIARASKISTSDIGNAHDFQIEKNKRFINPFSGGGMTTDEQEFLEKTYRHSASVFEWGMGSSSALAAYAGIAKLVSVDSFSEWVEKTKSAVKNNKYNFQFVNIGPVGDWGIPKEKQNIKWLEYSKKVSDEANPFDVYLVDGRFRVACACRALLHGRDDSLIMIHDFQRDYYQDILHVAEKVQQVGKLVKLKRKQNMEKQIQAMWEKYKYDYR